MLTSGVVAVTLSKLPIVASFDPLHHIGGNGPWFSAPNVFNIDAEPPTGCVVDQVAFVSRHGSRYPDPGAYNEWTATSAKVRCRTCIDEIRAHEIEPRSKLYHNLQRAQLPENMAANTPSP